MKLLLTTLITRQERTERNEGMVTLHRAKTLKMYLIDTV